MSLLTFNLILFCMLLNAAAQLLLKEAMNRIGVFTFTLQNLWPITVKVLLSPFILLGILCYIVSLAVWLLVLSRSEVSMVYPLTSIAFIMTAVGAWILFGENLTFVRLLGTIIIIFGIYLVTRT